jgi:hypothetical protein
MTKVIKETTNWTCATKSSHHKSMKKNKPPKIIIDGKNGNPIMKAQPKLIFECLKPTPLWFKPTPLHLFSLCWALPP